jgi:hypothetical protein
MQNHIDQEDDLSVEDFPASEYIHFWLAPQWHKQLPLQDHRVFGAVMVLDGILSIVTDSPVMRRR